MVAAAGLRLKSLRGCFVGMLSNPRLGQASLSEAREVHFGGAFLGLSGGTPIPPDSTGGLVIALPGSAAKSGAWKNPSVHEVPGACLGPGAAQKIPQTTTQ